VAPQGAWAKWERLSAVDANPAACFAFAPSEMAFMSLLTGKPVKKSRNPFIPTTCANQGSDITFPTEASAKELDS
jgi:hypothetical protein